METEARIVSFVLEVGSMDFTYTQTGDQPAQLEIDQHQMADVVWEIALQRGFWRYMNVVYLPFVFMDDEMDDDVEHFYLCYDMTKGQYVVWDNPMDSDELRNPPVYGAEWVTTAAFLLDEVIPYYDLFAADGSATGGLPARIREVFEGPERPWGEMYASCTRMPEVPGRVAEYSYLFMDGTRLNLLHEHAEVDLGPHAPDSEFELMGPDELSSIPTDTMYRA